MTTDPTPITAESDAQDEATTEAQEYAAKKAEAMLWLDAWVLDMQEFAANQRAQESEAAA